MSETVLLGAVAYDPKVVTIWEGFRDYFAKHGLDFDFILYSNYERQVEGHFAGQYNVAWNSPLAWIEAERVAQSKGRTARAVAMRDTDCDLTSVVVVPDGSPIKGLADLEGKKVGVGAADSPQATLIPLIHIKQAAGLTPKQDFAVVYHDKLVGKHGDHIGGERDAAKALAKGELDAICVIDGNLKLFTQEGTISNTRVVAQTPTYDHCNFTVLDDVDQGLVDRFVELLLGMSYDDPQVRPLLDLEGLKQWKPGRVEGYKLLNEAVDEFGYLDEWLAAQGAK